MASYEEFKEQMLANDPELKREYDALGEDRRLFDDLKEGLEQAIEITRNGEIDRGPDVGAEIIDGMTEYSRALFESLTKTHGLSESEALEILEWAHTNDIPPDKASKDIDRIAKIILATARHPENYQVEEEDPPDPELRRWYIAAVKRSLIADFAMMPEEADEAAEKFGLIGYIDRNPFVLQHDVPKSVAEDIVDYLLREEMETK